MALAIVLSGIETALPFMEGLLPVPRGIFGALSGLVTASALLARFKAQGIPAVDPTPPSTPPKGPTP